MFDFLTGTIEGAGPFGIFLLMLLENIFPPIPSELIMPFAGYLAADGRLPLWAVLVAGTAGSVLGATGWYVLARIWGEARFLRFIDRYGFWLTLERNEMEMALRWFRTKGVWAVLIGRCIPAIRTLISVPAGLAAMPLLPFLVVTTIGSVIWVCLLTFAGFLLHASYHLVETAINPVSTAVVVLVVGTYLWRIVRRLRR